MTAQTWHLPNSPSRPELLAPTFPSDVESNSTKNWTRRLPAPQTIPVMLYSRMPVSHHSLSKPAVAPRPSSPAVLPWCSRSSPVWESCFLEGASCPWAVPYVPSPGCGLTHPCSRLPLWFCQMDLSKEQMWPLPHPSRKSLRTSPSCLQKGPMFPSLAGTSDPCAMLGSCAHGPFATRAQFSRGTVCATSYMGMFPLPGVALHLAFLDKSYSSFGIHLKKTQVLSGLADAPEPWRSATYWAGVVFASASTKLVNSSIYHFWKYLLGPPTRT